MGQPNFARAERAALCDLLDTLGPDQPTLCEGWTTRDLAAHVLVRDRRPDAAAGAVIKPLAAHGERVRQATSTGDFAQVVDRVRRPTKFSMAGPSAIDRMVNTGEFFIHHEDVRRAAPGWAPREIPRGLASALHRQVRLATKFSLRKFPAKITLISPGYPPVTVGGGGPSITVTGDPGELALFFSGRQRAANVEVDGPAELVERLRTANLGI